MSRATTCGFCGGPNDCSGSHCEDCTRRLREADGLTSEDMQEGGAAADERVEEMKWQIRQMRSGPINGRSTV